MIKNENKPELNSYLNLAKLQTFQLSVLDLFVKYEKTGTQLWSIKVPKGILWKDPLTGEAHQQL